MIVSSTLVGIACLIANRGAVDTAPLEAQLSPADQAQVQEIIDSGACLPERMEKLLTDTQDKIDQGQFQELRGGGSPTRECAS